MLKKERQRAADGQVKDVRPTTLSSPYTVNHKSTNGNQEKREITSHTSDDENSLKLSRQKTYDVQRNSSLTQEKDDRLKTKICKLERFIF